MSPDFASYVSPSTWRYGSVRMRQLWSEEYKRRLWRRCWVALASAQHQMGMWGDEAYPLVHELVRNSGSVDLEKAAGFERATHHDVFAELITFRSQVSDAAGNLLHLGATSADIVENADAIRFNESVAVIQEKIDLLQKALYDLFEGSVGMPALGYTHLQPAEPLQWPDRWRMYRLEIDEAGQLIKPIMGKGFRGALGQHNAQHMAWLSKGVHTGEVRRLAADVNDLACETLYLVPVRASRQTPSRVGEMASMQGLSSLAAVLHKLALDVRLLCSMHELVLEKGPGQVGSSAMPHKTNPIQAENVCSLARLVPGLVSALWSDIANSALERTLDDSANRRYVLPEVFLVVDHMLTQMTRVMRRVKIDQKTVVDHLREQGHEVLKGWFIAWLQAQGKSHESAHQELAHPGIDWDNRLWEDIDVETMLACCSVLMGRGVKVDREAIV